MSQSMLHTTHPTEQTGQAIPLVQNVHAMQSAQTAKSAVGAIYNTHHDREGDVKEIEFQLKWQRK